MQKTVQNILNLIFNSFGKDGAVIGLSGLKRKNEYICITVPKNYKKTFIQNTENNYLLI